MDTRFKKMKKKLLFLISSTVLAIFALPGVGGQNAFAVAIQTPYRGYPYNYKGQLHIHTTESDGRQSPYDLEVAYRTAGYGFVSVSDHNRITTDPGASGILHLANGIEQTTDIIGGAPDKYSHVLGIGLPLDYDSTGDVYNHQQIINKMTAAGGYAIAAHPNSNATGGGWNQKKGWTIAQLKTPGLLGMSIFNAFAYSASGKYRSEEPLLGSLGSTALRKWDRVLSAGYRCWGFAVDDGHDVSETKQQYFDEGYIIVNSALAEPTTADIISNIVRGNFFASWKGPEISIKVNGSNIKVSVIGGGNYYIRFIGNRGVKLSQTYGPTATFTATESLLGSYIRVEVDDDKDRYKGGSGITYSQPMYVVPNLPRP